MLLPTSVLLEGHRPGTGKVKPVFPWLRGGAGGICANLRHMPRAVGRKSSVRINGRFARIDWTPVAPLDPAIPTKKLVAWFGETRCLLDHPLRDGPQPWWPTE